LGQESNYAVEAAARKFYFPTQTAKYPAVVSAVSYQPLAVSFDVIA
jgi:hypothetical protein